MGVSRHRSDGPDMLPTMAEETDELDEIRGAARDLWDAMGDPGTPTNESPAAATMRSEFKRLTDAGHTYEEIRDAVGGEILDLAERSD